jgi:predicted RNase H-like HicB family nuclease
MTKGDMGLLCILLKQPKGFTALCPDLDVASEGATPAQAKKMLSEAVEFHLEAAFENNLPPLRPIPPDQDPRKTSPETIIETFHIHADLSVQVHA